MTSTAQIKFIDLYLCIMKFLNLLPMYYRNRVKALLDETMQKNPSTKWAYLLLLFMDLVRLISEIVT